MMGNAFIDSAQFLWICPVLQCIWAHSMQQPWGVYWSGSSNSASLALTWCSLHPDFCTGMEVAPYSEVQHNNLSVASSCRVPQIWIPLFFLPEFHFIKFFLIASVRSILTSHRSHHIFCLGSVLQVPTGGPNSPWTTYCYVVEAGRVHKEGPVTAALLSCSLHHNPWQLHQLTCQ